MQHKYQSMTVKILVMMHWRLTWHFLMKCFHFFHYWSFEVRIFLVFSWYFIKFLNCTPLAGMVYSSQQFTCNTWISTVGRQNLSTYLHRSHAVCSGVGSFFFKWLQCTANTKHWLLPLACNGKRSISVPGLCHHHTK